MRSRKRGFMKKARIPVTTDDFPADWHVDCRGMPPPFPLLGTRAAVGLMNPGEVVLVLATDPEVQADVPAWCRMTGNRLVHRHERDGVFGYWIRKGRTGE